MRSMTIAAVGAAALFATPALTQQPSQGTGAIPDFSGIWGHPSYPGFEPPASGPGPVVNKSRLKGGPQKGVSDPNQFVGDYTNPILKPQAAEIVREHGEISLRGEGYPTSGNQCWPQGVPLAFGNQAMQMLQRPDKIVILYAPGHEVRHVRLNEPHPAQVTPSWYGDSVGHYEGDTLVIDTIGIKFGPYSMVDIYGTPYTHALHVVERYRLLDYEAAKEGLKRDAEENFRFGPGAPTVFNFDPNYRGRHLQLRFTVEDEGVFTMPWTATITYGRPLLPLGGWPEYVCAENPHEYYAGKDASIPRADKPDF
jgi:hypothetical protein